MDAAQARQPGFDDQAPGGLEVMRSELDDVERLRVVVRVEAVLVVLLAVLPAALVPLVISPGVTGVPVETAMVAVVEQLERAVVADDPDHFGPDERPQDRCDRLGVGVRRERVADVVE